MAFSKTEVGGGSRGPLCPAMPRNARMSVSTSRVRCRTGQTCSISGHYRFDGYTDGTWSPSPTAQEQNIPLSRNETFPPIRSSNKACYWWLVRAI